MPRDYKQFTLLARRKSKKSPDAAKRSALLKLVMPFLSSDSGKSLAEAVANKNVDDFKTKWGDVTNKLVAKLEEEFKNGKPEQKPKGGAKKEIKE